MGALWPDDRLLQRALIASLVLHLIFAYFIPSLSAFQGVGPTIETISFVKMVRMTIQRPAVNVRVAQAPKRAPIVSISKDARTLGTSPSPRQTAVVTTRENSAITTASKTQTGAAAAVSANTPTATPATDQSQSVASTQTRQQTGGFMPLGASDVPVMDPGVLKQLQTLGIHVRLTIVVDENGKTKGVTFNPELSSALETSIRSILASAQWDPAYCGGGIPCEGTATITL